MIWELLGAAVAYFYIYVLLPLFIIGCAWKALVWVLTLFVRPTRTQTPWAEPEPVNHDYSQRR